MVAALSGGVDSAVAAGLLLRQGLRVVGVTMRLGSWEDSASGHRRCCSLDDAEDARRVCHSLGIPFYYLNFEAPFAREVVEPLCREYSLGRTPNPCLDCNRKLKFGLLLEKALALGASYLATGHYARIDREGEGYRLLRGVDRLKDQSYFLYSLGQEQLPYCLFPLGGLAKGEVRALAREWGLPVAEKEESQELCFLDGGGLEKFLSQRLELSPGPILDREGKVIGKHRGLPFYTIGQRKGLCLYSSARQYVLALDPAQNAVIAGPEEALACQGLVAKEVHFVAGEHPQGSTPEVLAQGRYRSSPVPALLEPLNNDRWRVVFRQPQRAFAPGQAVVFYQGEEVLGGGIIEASFN